MGTILLIVVISILAASVLFALLREVVTWYFKINRLVAQNDEIIRLLEVIAYEDEEEEEKEDEKEIKN